VANFVIRLKNGTNNRYKGKLPLIFFNCDSIGHVANKCTHNKKKMMKMIQIENKHIKEKEPKIKSSRKVYASKKKTPNEMKMKSLKVRHKELYSWK
jgi:hypothetical protein